MDKRVLRERMRKKQQQIRRRQMMKKGAYIVAIILVFVFVIRGIILPVINRVGGKIQINRHRYRQKQIRMRISIREIQELRQQIEKTQNAANP